jgi:eukaryotic-like serine/threonine-protein kinase
MGIVYKARLIRLNRIVALKMILAGVHASKDAIERFVAEAETIAKLQHPNIVRIHTIGDHDGHPYVELEYVDGGTLSQRLEGRPWPARDAARLIKTLAGAIHEAHRMGIVHRDLKPSNILLSRDGGPKISDFGLAKTLEQDSGLTRTESILGSPCYMAPEQAEGRSKEVGPLADVYALGANLYELLTGRPPFLAATVLGTLEQVKNSEAVPPSRLVPGLPKEIDTICLKCLRKEPKERYDSANALAEDLARHLRYEPILARPASGWERLRKWIRRRPSVAALIAMSVLTLLSAIWVGLWYQNNVRAQAERSQARFARLRELAESTVRLGIETYQREDWTNAKPLLASALRLIRSEPHLADLVPSPQSYLDQCALRISEREQQRALQARLDEFRRLYDETHFYQSQHTGLEPSSNLLACRTSARLALDQAEGGAKDAIGPLLDHQCLCAEERAEVRSASYQLTLILAEAIAQPLSWETAREQAEAALHVLEGAKRFGQSTRSYHLRRSVYLDQLGEPNRAANERSLTESASSFKATAVDEFLMGEESHRRGDYSRAIGHFLRASSIEPRHFWAQYYLALCQLKLRNPAEALEALISCQNRRPGMAWVQLLKAMSEYELGEVALAEDDFRHAIRIGLPSEARCVLLTHRAAFRLRSGGSLTALDDLRSAVALEPNNLRAKALLVSAYLHLGEWDKAHDELEQAMAQNSSESSFFRLRSRIHMHRSNHVAALTDLDQSSRLVIPGDPWIFDDHLERGRICQRQRLWERALAACDQALASRPCDVQAHRLRGSVLVDLKRYEEAVSCFELCLSKAAPSPALNEALGLAHAWRGAHAESVLELSLALRAGRNSATVRQHRGWAYWFLGASKLAALDFEQAIYLSPIRMDCWVGLALARIEIDDRRGSIATADPSSVVGSDAPVRWSRVARGFLPIALRIHSPLSPLVTAIPNLTTHSRDTAEALKVATITATSAGDTRSVFDDLLLSDPRPAVEARSEIMMERGRSW